MSLGFQYGDCIFYPFKLLLGSFVFFSCRFRNRSTDIRPWRNRAVFFGGAGALATTRWAAMSGEADGGGRPDVTSVLPASSFFLAICGPFRRHTLKLKCKPLS